MAEEPAPKRACQRPTHQEFLERIMNPAIQHPMIDYLSRTLKRRGVVVHHEEIYIMNEYVYYWTDDIIHQVVFLWVLLGQPRVHKCSALCKCSRCDLAISCMMKP